MQPSLSAKAKAHDKPEKKGPAEQSAGPFLRRVSPRRNLTCYPETGDKTFSKRANLCFAASLDSDQPISALSRCFGDLIGGQFKFLAQLRQRLVFAQCSKRHAGLEFWRVGAPHSAPTVQISRTTSQNPPGTLRTNNDYQVKPANRATSRTCGVAMSTVCEHRRICIASGANP